MEYEVVIATRNRSSALRLSIPLILCQERPPRRVIIVDASDNHEEACRAITENKGDFLTNIEVLRARPNSVHQRNIGLEHVIAPVVIFPEDDSLW